MNAAAVETVGDATEAIPDSAKGHKKQLTSAAAAAGKPASTKTKAKVPASTSKEQPAVVEDPPATPTNVVTDQQPQKKVKPPKTAAPAATTAPAAPESPRQSSSRPQTAESPPSTKKKTTTKKVAPPQETAPPAEPPSPVAASPTAAQDESSSTAEDANFLYIQRVFGSDASKSLISRHEMDAAFPTVDDSRLNSRDNVKTLHVIDTSLPQTGDNETPSSGQDGDTPDEIMLRAGFLGQTKIVEEALRRGATLEYRDVAGRNILHYVVAAEVLSLVKRILKGMSRSSKEKAKSDKFKDSLNCVDNRGWTPLLIAVCKGFPSIVEVLVAYPECNTAITLKHSCRPNKGEQAESQAIHFACIRGDSATLTALLKASSTVKNAKDSKERTGLHYACASRKCAIDMLQTLCTDITQESIADLIAKDTDGETPLSLAIGWGNAHLVEYILVEYVAPYIRNCQGDESGEEQAVSLSTILLSRDANGLSGLDYANVRGHTESIASVNRLWPVIRHKERDPPTLAEALLARSPDSAEADWDSSKESVSLDSLSAVTTILLRQSARGSFLELSSLEQVVFETICTVTGEEGEEVRGQVARAVQKVGAESALKLLDVTMHIEKIGGQMTSDGRRRRTAGGVFYQLVKEELKKRDPTAFREIWKYISAEQNERNKQRKKQGSITSRDQAGRPKPTTQTSHESSLSSYLHSYSLEPEVIEQECAPPVAQPQPSVGGRRTGPQSTRVAAPPTQVGRPGSPSPSAKVPSFATLTTQYQNHSGPSALARTGQVPASKRIEHSASPPPPQSRFAGSSVAQSRSAERLGGAPQNRLTANRSPVRATHASMEVPRFAAMTEAAAGRLVGTNRTPTVDSPNRGGQAARGGVNASTRIPPNKNAPTTTTTGRSPNYGSTQSRSPPPSRDSVGSHSTGRQIAPVPNSPPQNRVVGAPAAASRVPTSAKGAQSSRAAGAPPANTQYARRGAKEEEETVDDEGEEEEEEEYEEEEEGTTSGLQPGGDVLDRDLSMTQKTNEEEEEEDYDIEEEGSFEMR